MYEFWSETLLQYYTAMKSYVYHSLSKIFEGNHLEHCIHSSMDNTFAQLVSILDNIYWNLKAITMHTAYGMSQSVLYHTS